MTPAVEGLLGWFSGLILLTLTAALLLLLLLDAELLGIGGVVTATGNETGGTLGNGVVGTGVETIGGLIGLIGVIGVIGAIALAGGGGALIVTADRGCATVAGMVPEGRT